LAKTTRVHILAKELGVTSKAILEKCRAENLDVKNHMSTISVGLAATIREWFSEGEHTTTVEQSERVDLKRVRRKKKTTKKKTAKAEEQAPAETTEAIESPEAPVAEPVATGTAVAEPEAAPAGEAPPSEPAELTAPAAEPAVSTTAAAAQAPDQVAGAEPGEPPAPQAPIETAPMPPEPEPEPEPIVPAGPMLEKPKPAQVTGPRVVRVESVEPDEVAPRRGGGPRSRRPRHDAPLSEPLVPTGKSVGGGRRRGRDKTHGRRKDVGDDQGQDRRRTMQLRMRARDLEDRRARLAAAGGQGLRARPSRRIETRRAGEPGHMHRPAKATISEPITVKELSAVLAAKSSEIIAKLMEQGVMATANQVISADMAELIALELGTELTVERQESAADRIARQFAERPRENLQRRPPVVTMLGHVDHGKTSLLDRIRSTSVAAGEAGGITQHIGAYQVDLGGKKVTFLDTPGHEAFTAMRARGAHMTDIVVLVVAADDGVMPQTVEAIHHAKAAEVPILVALNKIDLPGVDINRIYGQLAEHELTPTEWGGQTEVVKTSAVTGEGIEDLIEHIDFQAELKELQADPTIPATGWVVEARRTSTRGPVATLLIKEGVLKKGDVVLAGGCYGRVRTLTDSRGRRIKEAISSMPVEISGLDDVPEAGDQFFCLGDLNLAKEAAEQTRAQLREKTLARRAQVTLENLFSQIEAGQVKELNLIVKADVRGSVDVLVKYLSELSTDEVQVKILHAAVGGVTEGDVVLAEASGAIIIGFNVSADEQVKNIAESKGVDLRFYNVIYRITEDLKNAMVGMLEPEYQERELGRLTVRETFKVSSLGTIAGCYVNSGSVHRNAYLRLIRDNIVLRDKCTIESLKHFKDDVREVRAGLECGIKIAGFDDIKKDDVIEAYEIVEVARTL